MRMSNRYINSLYPVRCEGRLPTNFPKLEPTLEDWYSEGGGRNESPPGSLLGHELGAWVGPSFWEGVGMELDVYGWPSNY